MARWRPASLPPEVADFAQRAVTRAEPSSPARAKALLFAAAKLGTFATSVGLELVPETVLSPSLIERFIVTSAAALGPATRRTLRSNLRFLSAACITNAPPAPVPLSRERAKTPYSPAQIEAYLALADAQPTPARRQRLSGLVALGAGAGLHGGGPARRPRERCRGAFRRSDRLRGGRAPPGGPGAGAATTIEYSRRLASPGRAM